MNIGDDIKQLTPTGRELRKFGLMVGAVFAALGMVLWRRHPPAAPFLLTPGILLLTAGAIFPRALKYVYLAWMSLAIVIGFVVSQIILILFFFLVVTPIGRLARWCGKDFLRLKPDPAAATYWIRRARSAPRTPADHEKQY
jgi:hypothetical protein